MRRVSFSGLTDSENGQNKVFEKFKNSLRPVNCRVYSTEFSAVASDNFVKEDIFSSWD